MPFIISLSRHSAPYLPASRTKANIEYSSKDDVWIYGDQETTRSVKTVRGAKTLLKTVHLTELLIKEHLKNNRGSTLREIYYISENWDIAKFHEQAESDRLIEDLEIVTALHREDFHVRPEEDGAAVFGPLRSKSKLAAASGRCTARRMWARPATRYPSMWITSSFEPRCQNGHGH